jgi:hypothetical protein
MRKTIVPIFRVFESESLECQHRRGLHPEHRGVTQRSAGSDPTVEGMR